MKNVLSKFIYQQYAGNTIVSIGNIEKEAFQAIIDIMKFNLRMVNLSNPKDLISMIGEKIEEWKENQTNILLKEFRIPQHMNQHHVVQNIRKHFADVKVSFSL